MVERLVPEELWELFQRVVPPAPTRPQGGGRRWYGDREVLAAVIFVATTGCTWQQSPPVFGPSGPTAHRRFTEWSAARVWARLHRLVLDELGARGELDWSRCAIDSVSVRAGKGGADPADRSPPASATSGAGDQVGAVGRVTVNTAPSPGADRTVAVPLCACATAATIDRPSPAPPWSRDRAASAR